MHCPDAILLLSLDFERRGSFALGVVEPPQLEREPDQDVPSARLPPQPAELVRHLCAPVLELERLVDAPIRPRELGVDVKVDDLHEAEAAARQCLRLVDEPAGTLVVTRHQRAKGETMKNAGGTAIVPEVAKQSQALLPAGLGCGVVPAEARRVPVDPQRSRRELRAKRARALQQLSDSLHAFMRGVSIPERL